LNIVNPALRASFGLETLSFDHDLLLEVATPDTDLETETARLIETRHGKNLKKLSWPFDPEAPAFPRVACEELVLGHSQFYDNSKARKLCTADERSPWPKMLAQARCKTLVLHECFETMSFLGFSCPAGVENLVVYRNNDDVFFSKEIVTSLCDSLQRLTIVGCCRVFSPELDWPLFPLVKDIDIVVECQSNACFCRESHKLCTLAPSSRLECFTLANQCGERDQRLDSCFCGEPEAWFTPYLSKESSMRSFGFELAGKDLAKWESSEMKASFEVHGFQVCLEDSPVPSRKLLTLSR